MREQEDRLLEEQQTEEQLVGRKEQQALECKAKLLKEEVMQ